MVGDTGPADCRIDVPAPNYPGVPALEQCRELQRSHSDQIAVDERAENPANCEPKATLDGSRARSSFNDAAKAVG